MTSGNRLLACAVAVACLAGCGCSGRGSQPEAAGRKKGGDGVPVSVARVAQRRVPVEVEIVGNVEAYSTISVKAQVGGQIEQAHFREGDDVKTGDLLFTIDARPFQAALSQAEANVARDQAQLSQAEANLARDQAQEAYARAQAGRFDGLFRQGIISRDQTEQIRSSADALGSAVKADLAAIQSARASMAAMQAAVENARLQLGFTRIASPIGGRTGNITVKGGNVVMANSMELTTINQVQPIYVSFGVPEDRLPEIKRAMAAGKLPVTVYAPDDNAAVETGTLTFVDNSVDATTGTIRLKGTFANAGHKLWPGQFVRVVLRLSMQQNALVVPNQAVQTGQNGNFVFVVKADRTVESRPVTPGVRVQEDLVVDRGLVAGETVVTEGHLRLAPGMRVVVRDGRPGVPGNRAKART